MRKERLSKIVLILAGWTLLGIFSAARIKLNYFYLGNSIAWGRALFLALADWYAWAILSPLILWLVRRFPLEPRGWWLGVLVQVPASVVFTFLKMGIEFFARVQFTPEYARRFPRLEFFTNNFTFWAIIGAICAFDYYRKYRTHELRASTLETQLAQAQLHALRMQLNPHFLFNTLHAVSSLMRRDVEAADTMIARLSDLLRLTLESTGQQEVSLRQELAFLESYLEIEKTRFRDRLSIRLDIAPETLDAGVPNLILQPLVENAIRHGIGPRASGGTVEIQARLVDVALRVLVMDDGCGLPKGGDPVRDGVGLTNTRARLEQLYGRAHRFVLENRAMGGVTVSLVLPFRSVSDQPEKG